MWAAIAMVVVLAVAILAVCIKEFFGGMGKRGRQLDEWERRFGMAEACRRAAATASCERHRRKFTELAEQVEALGGGVDRKI